MKTLNIIIRWVVGVLFIFSGLIKANDPSGLSYKMQEFFEVWGLHGLHAYTLWFAIGMNILEVAAGVALLVQWRLKQTSWLLLLLIIFFSFLTGYALLSGKIKTCGCFGDCLPLSPLQSFIKDIILLVLIGYILLYSRKIKESVNTKLQTGIVLLSFILTWAIQWYVQLYLPIKDCLPYRKGNDILQQMQIPVGAMTDSSVAYFKYKKNNQLVEFSQENFPADFDSTYEYVDRFDKLIRKGNAVAPIPAFSFLTQEGNDTTAAIFDIPEYYLVMVLDLSTVSAWKNKTFDALMNQWNSQKKPWFIVTADAAGANTNFKKENILLCDATVLKTAARVNATYFEMKGSSIQNKLSYKKAAQLLK